jgi:hypothetical protein
MLFYRQVENQYFLGRYEEKFVKCGEMNSVVTGLILLDNQQIYDESHFLKQKMVIKNMLCDEISSYETGMILCTNMEKCDEDQYFKQKKMISGVLCDEMNRWESGIII